MSTADAAKWDTRHRDAGAIASHLRLPPSAFVDHVAHLPQSGRALELACGRGSEALWLADRGLRYFGVDVSPVAIELARLSAEEAGLSDRCEFEVHDLDDGLPGGPEVDLLLCHRFRDERLDREIIERIKPGGVLAISVLSEVGRGPGPFRARPGELREAFDAMEVLAEVEGDGIATLVARQPRRRPEPGRDAPDG